MKIVIDIPDERYKNIRDQVDKGDYPDMQIGRAIVEGIQLPKGHGRLVDADAELKELNKMKVGGEVFTTALNFAKIEFEQAPTIIEAESGIIDRHISEVGTSKSLPEGSE